MSTSCTYMVPLVFLDPTKRNTWQSHAIDAWYVEPATKHYRNYHFFIPETKAIEHRLGKIFPSTLQNASHRTSNQETPYD